MNTRALFPFLAAALVVAASGCTYETLAEHPCPPGGTPLTYENFGQSFFIGYCNRCHSAELGLRNGAPPDYVFDTQADVIHYKDRIFVRAAGPNDSMPPGPDDPPLKQRDELADWLACGAK